LGTEIFVNNIYGQRKKIKVMAGTQVGDRIFLPGEGFFKPNSNEKGAHYINLKIEIPRSLSEKEKQTFIYLKEKEKERKK